MTFLVVANFKSNLTQKQVAAWIAQVKPTANMVVAPSFPHLHLFSNFEFRNSNFALAGQDVSPFPPGSYTGAVSARELKELGVSYAIIGHSERRRYFHETDTDIASKVRELVSEDITPLLCLDEKDLASQLSALDAQLAAHCYFCFEPTQSIGGTAAASDENIIHFKTKLHEFYPDAPFIYGGSVNQDNIDSLLKLGLDGVLVATASLDPAHYLSILAKVSHADRS